MSGLITDIFTCHENPYFQDILAKDSYYQYGKIVETYWVVISILNLLWKLFFAWKPLLF